MQDDLNKLTNSLDIVEVIGDYIPLTKKGRNYFGLCPFHDDHSPSLSVSKEKQIYRCFVCGESGNVINFVMNYEHISFKETLALLSKKAGITLSDMPNDKVDPNAKYYEIMNLANKFYQNNLMSDEGELARNYLAKRMLSDDIIKEFEIGLSLKNTNMLNKLLINKGYSLESLNSIDLANNNYDSFINRIMFPLHNNYGQVIGFSGRIYDNSDMNKYQNSRENLLFKKREVIFNYHRAKEEIRKKKCVIVMEGFMAVIRSHSVGIKNCIATMGTSLTQEQTKMISRLSNNIYLCYDGDNAGSMATLKNGEIFMKMNINPFVIKLSDNLDPDDYILKYGVDSFQNLIDNAIRFSDFKLKNIKNGYNLNNIDDKTRYVNIMLENIKEENDVIKREIMLRSLANDTNIWYNTLEKKLFEILDKQEVDKNIIKKEELVVIKPKKDKYVKAMESLVYFMLNSQEAITLVNNSELFIPDKEIRMLVDEIIYYYEKYGYVNEADFYSYLLDNEDLFNALKRVLTNDFNSEFSMELVKENISAINNYNYALEIKDLEKKIKDETDIETQIKYMEELRVLKMAREKSC